jgi:hypothetical protein
MGCAWSGGGGWSANIANARWRAVTIFFPKFQNQHKILIQIGDLPDVQNLPNFAGR